MDRKRFYSRTFLALGAFLALSSGLPGVIQAADTKPTEEIAIDNSQLDAAVKKAKDAGVAVTQNSTKNNLVGSDQVAAKKKDIAADYQKQISSLDKTTSDYQKETQQYNTDLAKYQKDLAAYEKEAKNPKTNSSEWSQEQIDSFLNGDAANVSVVSGNSSSHNVKMGTEVQNGVKPIAKSKLPAQVQKSINKSLDNKTGDIYKLQKGLAVKYTHAFTDAKTDKDVDVLWTISGYSGTNSQYFPYVSIDKDQIGNGILGNAKSISYNLKFYEAGTNKPISIDALMGYGDIDQMQWTSLNNSGAAILHGKKLTQSGTKLSSTEEVDVKPSNLDYQGWYLPKNITEANYNFGSNSTIGQVASRYNVTYHEIGNLTKPYNLPKKPIPPVKPTVAKASYNYQALKAELPTPVKKADNEGKTVAPGQTTTQHVTQSTGYNDFKQGFILGDDIFYTKDGRLPVSVDLKKVTVTDNQNKNVTDQFNLKLAKDTKVNNNRVAEITASAKKPGDLKENTQYTLNIQQTALDDHKADQEIDQGFSNLAKNKTFTDKHSYNEPTITPHKQNLDANNNDIDKDSLLQGDQVNYKLTLDAVQLNNLVEKLNKLGLEDNYDQNYWIPSKDQISFATDDSKLKADLADFNIKWDDQNGSVSIMAKDPAKFAGHKVFVTLKGTVKKDAKKGEFKNTATQLTNDSKTNTETVQNNVPDVKPQKDVVADNNHKSSINNREVALHADFDYKLISSLRPANYGGDTKNWSIYDDYDQAKDQVTKKYSVITNYDIKNGDDTIKAGSDVTSYFKQEFFDKKGAVKYTAKQTFLDLLNKPENKKSKQQFVVYAQFNRIGTGTVYNTFTENINGNDYESNRVVTKTPEPKEPAKPQNPTKPQSPKQTKKEQSLPQTGDAIKRNPLFAVLGVGLIAVLSGSMAAIALKTKY